MSHIGYTLTTDGLLTLTIVGLLPGDRIVLRGRRTARRRDGRTRGRRTRAVIQKPQHVQIRLDTMPNKAP